MASQKLLGLPPVPPELKPTTAYLQRAEELKVQDPVAAYWSAYYAAQAGIALKTKDPQSRDFLFSLLTTLESLKREIGANEAIDNEAVSAAYMENFALRVFVNVDNEDRKGAATRATAKKFMAAANFLEVLRTFPKTELTDANEDRIRYAKWKAADIAKAFREGRKPTPGPPGQAADEIDPTEPLLSPPPPSSPLKAQHVRHGSTTPPAGHPTTANHSYQTQPQVSPHYAQQFAGSSPSDVSMAWSTTANVGVTDPISPPFNQAHDDSINDKRSASRSPNGSLRGSPSNKDSPSRKAWVSDELENPQPYLPSTRPAGSPQAPGFGSPPRSPPKIDTKKTVHFTPSVVGGSSDVATPASAAYATAGESPRDEDFGVTRHGPRVPPPAPAMQPPPIIPAHPPVVSGSPPRAHNLPPSWPATNLPPTIPHELAPPGPPVPPYPHNYIVPPLPPPLPQPVAPPAVPPPPFELTVQIVSKAQKHCRYAISALDYDDAETARKELRAALALLGG